jgi:outer membrane receptor for ferrienterochelin and colicins
MKILWKQILKGFQNRKQFKLFFFFVVLLISATASAQTTIKGIIEDAETNNPLVSATIVIQDTQEGTLTDTEGHFTLNTSLSLPLKLEVSYLGYLTKEIELASAASLIEIQLRRNVYEITKILVSASRKKEKAMDAPSSISILEANKLQSDVVTHPLMSLRNLPGIDLQEQGIGAYQISLRGGTDPFGIQSLILVDYRQLITPGFIAVPFSTSPVDAIDLARIEVVRGPGSALYGPGVEEGVVHFLSKDPFTYPGTTLSVFGGEHASFGLSARHAGVINKRLGYKILGIYSRADNWDFDPNDPTDARTVAGFKDNFFSAATGEPLDVNTDFTEVKRMSISGTLAYKLNDQTTLTATGGYSEYTGRGLAVEFFKYNSLPNIFGQVRLQSERLFAQVYARNVPDKAITIEYPSGVAFYADNTQLEGQVQYQFDKWAGGRLQFITGADYRVIFLDTKGTYSGRNEDNDDYSILGGYGQLEWEVNPQFRFVAASRVDHFSAIDQTTFSPRLALVCQPKANHSFRLTYNRSFGLLSANENFFDLFFESTPLFDIWLWGSAIPIEYPNPPVMTSYFGLPPSDKLGIPLPTAFQIVLVQLSSNEDGFSPELTAYLQSLAPQITGFSDGIMTRNGQPVNQLFTRSEPSKATQTDQFEIGYKGLMGEKLAVGVDIYYNQRKNFLSPQQANPVVSTPMLGDDLSSALMKILDPDELPGDMTPQEVAEDFEKAGTELGYNRDDNDNINGIGVIEPLGIFSDDRPEQILAFLNFGKITYWGADLSLKYYFKDDFSVFANYTWLSDQYFDSEELGEQGRSYTLNNSPNRIRLGIDYLPAKAWHASAALRYQEGFKVFFFDMEYSLPSTAVFDAGFGYNFNFGLSLDITAQNLLDRRYRPFPTMPKIGRLVLAKATYSF